MTASSLLQSEQYVATPTREKAEQITRQIAGLDLIRFVAALLVVAYHLGYAVPLELGYEKAGDALSTLAPLLRYGWVGVPVFFVLSGFVITYSAEKASALDFLRGRLLRLYPAVWVCCTLTLLGILASSSFHPFYVRQWMSAMLLLPFASLIDGSYWTLGIEMAFYAVVCLLLVAHRFRWLMQLAITLTTLNTCALLLIFFQERGALSSATAHAASFAHTRLGQVLLLQHGVFFAIGITLWLCLFRGITAGRIALLALSIPCALLSIRMEWHEIMNEVGTYFTPYPTVVLWLLLTTAMVLSVVWNASFLALLGTRGVAITRTLGLATYPLYLLHQRLGGILIARTHGLIPDVASCLLAGVFSVLLAYLVIRYAEPPLRHAFRRVLHGPRRPAGIPATSLP